MLQSILTQLKPLPCQKHKKQPITHICTDLKCGTSAILCPQCIAEGFVPNDHYDHEQQVLPISDGIQQLCELIKMQYTPVQKLYKSTLARSDFSALVVQLERGSKMVQELDERIHMIKNQMQMQIQILMKQIEKIIAVEKEEYYKILDNYRKIFIKNHQYLQRYTQPLISYQHEIKYYLNPNNFYIKLVSELTKKSNWLERTKSILHELEKSKENYGYHNQINHLLNTCQKIKFDATPKWKGEDWIGKNSEYKFVIRRIVNQWIYVPQGKVLEEEIEKIENGGYGTNNHQGGIGVKNYYVQKNGK